MKNQIRLQRISNRLTQWDLANLTGISQSRISLFEIGHIQLKDEELARIQQALDIAPGNSAVESETTQTAA